jgi:hypothetical protein
VTAPGRQGALEADAADPVRAELEDLAVALIDHGSGGAAAGGQPDELHQAVLGLLERLDALEPELVPRARDAVAPAAQRRPAADGVLVEERGRHVPDHVLREPFDPDVIVAAVPVLVGAQDPGNPVTGHAGKYRRRA